MANWQPAGCLVILFAIFISFMAVLAGLHYNHVLPEGLPDDQIWSARVCGGRKQMLMFMANAASSLGIGPSPIENLKALQEWLLAQNVVEDDERDLLQIQDIKIANIPVRIYKPKHLFNDATRKTTGVVYLHGGGWTTRSVAQYHPLTYRLAKEADVVLISVEYRLAPVHTFPIQFHDCYGVIETLLATGDKYGIDTNRVVVAGDSAGGNLAAAVALKLRDENIRLAAQILIYPALQFMDFSLPSIKKQSSPLLTRDKLAVLWSYYMTGMPNMASSFLENSHSMHLRNTKYSSYVGVEDNELQLKQPKKALDNIPKAVLDGLTDYRVSPLMADSLKGLPKTLLITCEYDVLKDDGLLYKARLLGAGVKVTHYNYMSYHDLVLVQTNLQFRTEEYRQAFRDIVDYIKEV